MVPEAEIHACAAPRCPHPGTARCGSCKVATYCGRSCQVAAWKHHKTACKQITEIGVQLCQLLKQHNLICNPWSEFMLDFKEMDPEPLPAIYAEFDPKTRAVRKFGSTLNYAETMKEERLHSKDGIFHSVVDLCHCFRKADKDPLFQKQVQELWDALLRIAPIGRDADLKRKDMAFLRAMEGALGKVNAGGKKFWS